MQAEYISKELWQVIIPHMTQSNALAIAVSLETGMRVGDVLKLRSYDLGEDSLTYVAEKTGKERTVKCSPEIISLLWQNMRSDWCFPPRRNSKSLHRTRQTVWKDVRKAAQRCGLVSHVSPHSARKTFAVGLYHKKGIGAVQEALQHTSPHISNLYALSDVQGLNYNRGAVAEEVYIRVMQKMSDLVGIDLLELPCKVKE